MVLAASKESFVKSMVGDCTVMEMVLILVPWPFQGDPNDFNQDLVLTWCTVSRIYCEMNGGMRGPASHNSGGVVSCINSPSTGQKSKGLLIFRTPCLSIALPAIFTAVGVVFFACWSSRNCSGANAVRGNNISADVTLQETVIMTGLDESTIESFDKVVLGKSLRVIGPNDGTCPICLSEYQVKEILGCIPECKHCFHADCIDEWPRMSTTCPVCRNSPSPSHNPIP